MPNARLLLGCTLIVVLLAPAFAADGPATRPAPTSQPAAAPASQPAAPPVLCPVTGRPVDRHFVARFRGRWVYFADEPAQKKFTADPYEFAEAVQAQWEADPVLRMQVRCPVTGDVVDSAVFVGQGEDAVYFASAGAREKWTQAGAAQQDEYRRKLADCYTFQTGCATCGGLISPGAHKDVDGQTLYFCCLGCAKHLDAEKAKFLAQVAEQIKTHRVAWEARAAGETKKK
jgi:YHS domain-containing protein